MIRAVKHTTKKRKGFFPGGVEQVFVSLFLILLGAGFCLIPIVFGLNATVSNRGNRGPGGLAALIVGIPFLLLGLVGLCNSIIKFLVRMVK